MKGRQSLTSERLPPLLLWLHGHLEPTFLVGGLASACVWAKRRTPKGGNKQSALLFLANNNKNNINAQFVMEYSVMPGDKCYLIWRNVSKNAWNAVKVSEIAHAEKCRKRVLFTSILLTRREAFQKFTCRVWKVHVSRSKTSRMNSVETSCQKVCNFGSKRLFLPCVVSKMTNRNKMAVAWRFF